MRMFDQGREGVFESPDEVASIYKCGGPELQLYYYHPARLFTCPPQSTLQAAQRIHPDERSV